MDKQTLIERLNDDLAGELQAITMYIQYAALVNGLHRPQLSQFFKGEIADELLHAQYIAEKVVALGGVPATQAKPVAPVKTNRDMVQAVHDAEAATIESYRQRIKDADDYGDIDLRVQYENMVADETKHMEETAKMLAGM
jgi:bacterioferritin